jgi:hypothetical protein
VFMYNPPRTIASRRLTAVLGVTLCAVGTMLATIFCSQSLLAQTQPAQTLVRQVKIAGNKGAVEIEVEASDRITPQTQVLTGPDRLVVDFPNSVPGTALRNQSVNLGEVKDVRFGLYQSKPPVTRLVLDLKSAQSFQIFPYGRTVMIKVTGAQGDAASATGVNVSAPPATPALVITNYSANSSMGANRLQQNAQLQNARQQSASQPNVSPKPSVEVTFRNGLLAIKANKATFSEVLFAVQQRTGADIAIPAGSDEERIVADLGPGQPQEVLASLLNGSNFNFLILNSANDPRQLDRVILTPRTRVSMMASPHTAQPSDDASFDGPPPQPDAHPPQPVAGLPQPEIPPGQPRPVEDDPPVQ